MGRAGKGFGAIFQGVVKALRRHRISYMVAGGLAANYHGMPRPRFEIDLVVKLDGNGLEPLLQMTRKLGFALDRNEAEQTFRLGDHLVVTSPSHPFRMGLWWVRTAYDQVALARRRKARVQGETAWFCSPEDTVLSLLGAGRDRDVDAAGGIMGVQKGRLDWGYLRHWARPLSVDDRLERLRRELFI